LTLVLPSPSDAELRSLCSTLISGFLSTHFTPDIQGLLRPLVDATVLLHAAAVDELLPTPAHPTYVFTQRSVLRVLQAR
jgi:hypothetical protein